MVNGVAKTYAMTGWRVGWMIGPADAITAATNLQSHETSNVANVSQRAALAAVSGDLSAAAEMRQAFDRRRKTIHSMLNEIEGSSAPPRGGVLRLPVGGGAVRTRYPGPALRVQRRAGRPGHRGGQGGGRAGEAFGAPGYFRLSYALGDDDLVEGVSRLAKLFGDAG